MTRAIHFVVPGLPVAQPRQRHRIVAGAERAFVQNYTEQKHPVQAFKAAVRLCASQANDGAPLQGPLALRVTFVFPRPKTLRWKRKDMPRLWKVTKPDADNLIKSVKDALTGIVWADDAQVVWLEVTKVIAAGNEESRTEVGISELAGLGG